VLAVSVHGLVVKIKLFCYVPETWLAAYPYKTLVYGEHVRVSTDCTDPRHPYTATLWPRLPAGTSSMKLFVSLRGAFRPLLVPDSHH
jgi:hypothetical protein